MACLGCLGLLLGLLFGLNVFGGKLKTPSIGIGADVDIDADIDGPDVDIDGPDVDVDVNGPDVDLEGVILNETSV